MIIGHNVAILVPDETGPRTLGDRHDVESELVTPAYKTAHTVRLQGQIYKMETVWKAALYFKHE
jgi:hypothetical protein